MPDSGGRAGTKRCDGGVAGGFTRAGGTGSPGAGDAAEPPPPAAASIEPAFAPAVRCSGAGGAAEAPTGATVDVSAAGATVGDAVVALPLAMRWSPTTAPPRATVATASHASHTHERVPRWRIPTGGVAVRVCRGSTAMVGATGELRTMLPARTGARPANRSASSFTRSLRPVRGYELHASSAAIATAA